MPMKPQQYHPLGPNGRKVAAQQYERQRGTSAERGYGSRWQRYRVGFLTDHPICARCGQMVGPHGHVDHIKAVSGPDDPAFWDVGNHQTLCPRCHSLKTAEEDGSFGRPAKPPQGQPGAREWSQGVGGQDPPGSPG